MIESTFASTSQSPFAPGGSSRTEQQSGIDFTSLLMSKANGPAAGTPSSVDEARDAAEQLVAVAFVQPVLKQIRDSDGAADPFKPSEGERQFGAMLDEDIAAKLVKSAQWPLVDRLTRDLLGGAEPSTPQTTRTNQED